MACDLGSVLEDSKDSVRKRQHAVLFGLCYIWDKDNALRSGQPPLLTEDYCNLTFMETTGDNYPDLKLSLVKERTCRLLYSQKAAKLSDGEILQTIRQLDHELEQWRLSIPLSTRPQLSRRFPPGTNDRKSRQHIHLQLEYHYTLIAIHTMVRKCGATDAELPEDLHSVIHSSVDLSLEAGRSTLMFLQSTLRLLGGEAFQYVFRPLLFPS